jgi:hypothetical protein
VSLGTSLDGDFFGGLLWHSSLGVTGFPRDDVMVYDWQNEILIFVIKTPIGLKQFARMFLFQDVARQDQVYEGLGCYYVGKAFTW